MSKENMASNSMDEKVAKRNVSDEVVSGTLFSLDHRLYASDYDSDSDSDSVASENQPLVV